MRLSEEIKAKIDELSLQKGDLFLFRDIFEASFMFSLTMILKREWKTYLRDKMKFGIMIMSTILRFFFVGILFKDVVPSRELTNLNPIRALAEAQSVAFICIASTVNIAINTVALSSRHLFI